MSNATGTASHDLIDPTWRGIRLPLPRSSIVYLILLVIVATNIAATAMEEPLPAGTLIGSNWWFGAPGPAAMTWLSETRLRVIRIGGINFDRKLPDQQTLIEWVQDIRKGGAEPLIQVSQYRSPEEAAALVKLFNQDKVAGTPVRLWSIGNEPWLENKRPQLDQLPALISRYFLPTAAAMKEVDPTITIVGPDECDYFQEVYERLFGGSNNIAGRVPGKDYYYCDGITWHRYPQNTNEPGLSEVEDFRSRIERCARLTAMANEKLGRSGTHAPMAFT